jgi:hypothetical protein
MPRKHALLVSLLLGLAAVVGLVAGLRTVGHASPAASASHVSTAAIVRRQHTLDRLEASLRRSLAQRTPKLPPVPSGSAPVAAAVPVRAPQVLYVRPKPIVVHVHRSGEHERGDTEAEGHAGGGDD